MSSWNGTTDASGSGIKLVTIGQYPNRAAVGGSNPSAGLLMHNHVSLNGDRKRFMLTVLQDLSESYAES